MNRTKWLDRKFNFDFPAGMLPAISERLEGTYARLKYILKDLNSEQLEFRPEGKWSIKEHIGHLTATENLHKGRISDILEKRKELRAAGFRSDTADYNITDIDTLLDKFNKTRNGFIEKITELNDEQQNLQSFHPRLLVMMRPVDIAYFAAEHDDHHLASIREMINFIKTKDMIR